MAMAIVFADSFSHYPTALLGLKWSNQATYTYIGAYGRRSSAGLLVDPLQTLYRLLPAATQDVGVAFGFYPTTWGAASPGFAIVRIYDVATVQVDVRLDDAGHIIVTRNGTVLGTSTLQIPSLNVYHHLEVLAHIADSPDGWVAVRVDGVEWLYITGVDTQATANATASTILVGGAGAGSGFIAQLDDIVVQSGSGASYPSSMLGDCGVYFLAPDAAGNYNSQFSRVGAGVDSDYKAVDDPSPPDDDTTYIASLTVGHKSSWSYPAPAPTAGSVKAVQLVLDLRKDDAGAHTVRPFVRIGGTDYTGTTVSVGDTYGMVRQLWLVNPATTSEWVLGDFPLEVGLEVIS